MTLPVPTQRTWTTGDIVTAAMMNGNVRDAVNFLANVPLFVGEQTIAQSVNSAAFTAITWDTNVIDTYSGHSTVTNPSRYTAQVAGTYRIHARDSFGASATGRRMGKIMKNGADLLGSQVEVAVNPTASGLTTVWSEYEVACAVSDYLEFFVYQSSGGALGTSVASPAGGFVVVQWIHA